MVIHFLMSVQYIGTSFLRSSTCLIHKFISGDNSSDFDVLMKIDVLEGEMAAHKDL